MWTRDGFAKLANWFYDAGFDVDVKMGHRDYPADHDFWQGIASSDDVEFRFFWDSSGTRERAND